MFKINNYINLFIFFALFFLVIKFDSFSKISTKLETILPNTQNKEFLLEFSKFKNSKKLFLSYKGFDKESLKQLNILEEKLLTIPGLKLDKFTKNKALEEHNNIYKLYTSKINYKKLENIDVKNALEEIKSKMINSSFGFNLNIYDPFNLFIEKDTKETFLKNSHLFLKNYGYLSIFTFESYINNLDEYKRVYDDIHTIINNQDHEIKVFSSLFYFVESSSKIKADVNKIILLSSMFLILLYIIILRNIKLLFNTLLTLTSSILFSLFVSTFIFEQVSIFVLVFGISISTVAIDYMFHNYMNKHYEKKKSFNKNVFFGMFTTCGSFFILSFISYDLIKQISYFAIFSLLFSYVQFSFLYPKIKFITKRIKQKSNKNSFYVKPYLLSIFSLFIILFTFRSIDFDLNIKNLDTQNTKLQEIQNFFFSKLQTKQKISVLLKASSIEELITNSKDLKSKYKNSYIPLSSLLNKKEFKTRSEELKRLKINGLQKKIQEQADKLGFRKDFFKLSYMSESAFPLYNLKLLNKYDLDIRVYKDIFLSYALINKDNESEIYKLPYIQSLSVKSMFEKSLLSLYKDLVFLGSISLVFIFLMLFLICKQNYLVAINFILFPLALILLSSLFIKFNILHLFMIFVILAIGIDFGIYLSSKELNKNTLHAIYYSLLSTFAGFGVLIFSNINALFSIGLIASIGIISLIILLLFSKKVYNDT